MIRPLRRREVLVLLFAGGLALVSSAASAVMAPHNSTNAIQCGDCHAMDAWGADPTLQLGKKFLRDCTRCHNNLSGGGYDRNNAPAVQTHSAQSIGSTRYGDWRKECGDCHGHRIDDVAAVTGTFLSSSSDGTTTTFVLQPDYAVIDSQWADIATWSQKRGPERGLIFALRYTKSDGSQVVRSAEIVDSYLDAANGGAPTVVVQGVLGNLADGTAPDGYFEIGYGMFIKKVPSALAVDPETGEPLTADFHSPHTFAYDESGTGVDPTPTGICQVCHTQTKHWRADGSLADNHFSGQDCTQCHDHRKGFKPRCDLCHGEPPVVGTPCVEDGEGTSIGLVCDPAPTGSATAGQHALHVSPPPAGYGFACTMCHFNGMPATDVLGNNKIQIGFDVYGLSAAGTSYDGQPAVTYEGTNGTTVTNNGSMRCSNVYCHSQGKRLLTAVQDGDLPSTSPAWDGSSVDADGFSCNNCHAYPPTFDAHFYHTSRGFTCSTCHYATAPTDTVIADKTLHVNGRYDVIPAPGFWYRTKWHPLDFDYTFAPDGGTCSSNTCHQYIVFEDPKQWRNRPQIITGARLNVTQGVCTGGTPTAPLASSTISVDVTVPCPDCVAPYSCDFDWGDGSPVETNVPCNTTHTYTDRIPSNYDAASNSYKPDPTGNVIGGFDITWTVRDAMNVPLDVGTITQRVDVCGLPNQDPTPAFRIDPGPDAAAYDVILTDLSVDPDAALGTHWDWQSSGANVIPGTIYIDWGYGSPTEAPVTLGETPSNAQFQMTYPAAGYYWIWHGVKDNDSSSDYIWSPAFRLFVDKNVAY